MVCLPTFNLVLQDYYKTNFQFQKGKQEEKIFMHGPQFAPLPLPCPVVSYPDQFASIL